MPLLLILIFGMIEMGRAWNAKITLSHAAREGVRELAVSGDQGAAEAIARTSAETSLPAGTVSSSSTACNPGSPTSVTLDHTFTITIPFVTTTSFNMASTGVMRCEL